MWAAVLMRRAVVVSVFMPRVAMERRPKDIRVPPDLTGKRHRSLPRRRSIVVSEHVRHAMCHNIARDRIFVLM